MADPVSDAAEMLASVCGGVVAKRRYQVTFAGRVWDVDMFHGVNAPLITAEVELPSADTTVELPDWVTEEVTGDHRYSNNNLAVRPYSTW